REARLPKQWLVDSSDVGVETGEFVEQNAGVRQHALDLVGDLRDRARRGVYRQVGRRRRLIVVADPGKSMQRAGARLGVMALGIAALANLRRRCDKDLAKRGVGNAACRGA